MSLRWQISAGELFELTRPAAFALSALVSAWVLASARRQGFPIYTVAAVTLATLFYPLVILPLYLIARAARRQPKTSAQTAAQLETTGDAPPVEQTTEPDSKPAVTTTTDDAATTASSERTRQKSAPVTAQRLRRTLPLLYLFVVLSSGALLYFLDAQSVDAHLARANRARVLGQREKTIRELRAALRLEENGHTRNLLGIELAEAGQPEEALAEFLAAERAGEPDDELPHRIATTLDALNRHAEAVPEYQKFLNTRRCTDAYPDPQCEAARARVGK